jgi:hypothetical protein
VFCWWIVSSNSDVIFPPLTEIFLGPYSNVRHGVCSSSDSLVARLAVPDSDGMSLDSGLSAEGADVFGVLGDFHLLYLLSQGSTVSGRIEPSVSDLVLE